MSILSTTNKELLHGRLFSSQRGIVPKVDFEFEPNQKDLNRAQIEITDQTYIHGALIYSLLYERNERARKKALSDTLNPFFKFMRDHHDGEKVLFPGCGTARDLEITREEGFDVYGIDKSFSMVEIANQILSAQVAGGQVPLAVMDILELSLPEKFDGVFCESALSHIKKEDIPQVLTSFADLMNPGAIALFGFRGSQTGDVYRTQDDVGIRYNTSYTESELEKFFSASPYRVIEVRRAEHPVPARPGFINYFVQRK